MLLSQSSFSVKKKGRSFIAHFRRSSVSSSAALIFFTSLLGVTNFRIMSSDSCLFVLSSETGQCVEVEDVLSDSHGVVSSALSTSTKHLSASMSMVDN